MMNGNRSLMYAVIRNLLENSVKYAGKGAEIHIESSRHVDHLELCYYDNGAGVSESQLGRRLTHDFPICFFMLFSEGMIVAGQFA